MRRSWPFLLAVAALGCLVVLGSIPANAYYSPLPATATFTSNSVTRTVNDPRLQQDVGFTATIYGPNAGFVDLQQDRGVMAWVYHTGTAYYVTCSVYDPGDSTFKEDTEGPFGSVSQLQVKDGVVVYLAGVQGGTSDLPDQSAMVKYATYDAARGAWKYKDYELSSGETNFTFVIKDGVVASQFSTTNTTCIDVALYDPLIGQWSGNAGTCVGGLNGPGQLMSLSISNATVYYQFANDVMKTLGYREGGWQNNGTTKPMAYFAAKPQSGWAPPLWVWFTDMSIGATQWNWNFGDNSISIERSPHNNYTGSGTFPVFLSINNGASNYTRHIKIYPWSALTWSTAYSAMVSQADLDMLRQYRDEIMTGTASGRQYRTELYNNSEAALKVLLQNPEMLVTLRRLFLANRGAIRQALRGREGVINDPEAVEAFLKTFEKKSPPGLRALTNNIRSEMRRRQRHGQPFLGFRMRH